ncbi:MAG: serine/threonine protein kinase [Prevotella sp.]|nr:serine/threonine protein kinase [Prevotella sp.]
MSFSSSFSDHQFSFPDAEPLPIGGSTCDCFRVRLYGKLHFLKRLKEELRDDPRYRVALQKEFETGYQFEHPHLVRFVSMTDDAILMDYVDGETLDVFTKNHPDYFTHRDNADRFLRQLLDVVGYLHEHQVIHLDLKPSNILLTRIGHEVKLIDLGFCYTDAYPDTTGRTDKYAAPEQFDMYGEKPTPRTDIYAIGKILQVLPCERFYRDIIQKCTAQNPDNRFSSTSELARQLHSRSFTFRRILIPALLLLAVILCVIFIRTCTTQDKVQQHISKEVVSKDTLPADTVLSSSTTSSSQTVSATTVSPSEPSDPSLQSRPSSVPVAAETASRTVTRTKTMTTGEIKQRISSVVEPIFQRMMGHLRDSAWNNHTEKLYNNLYLPYLNQCGDKVRVLWNQLSREYEIDERTFYHQYSDVNNNLQDKLYYQMKQNTKKGGGGLN